MRHGVVWLSAALVTIVAIVTPAVIFVAGDRQTCGHTLNRRMVSIEPAAGTPLVAESDLPDEQKIIAACSRLIYLAPGDAHAYTNRGLIYLAKADYGDAIADFDQAIRLDPKFIWPYYDRALAYLAKADYDRAIADFDQAIRLDPKFYMAYNGRGGAYGTGKHDYERAIADLDMAIQLNPESAAVYLNRARTYESKGDLGRALADFDQSLRLDPGNAATKQNRERIAAADDRKTCESTPSEEAIAACGRLINLNPDDADAYIGRGNAFLVKTDYDRAIADFDQAIKRDPKFVLSYYDRGVAYTLKADYDRAIADFDEAIKLNPKFSLPYNGRGGAYSTGKHDYDRAIADFDQAILLAPKSAAAYKNRASAYESKGDYGRALADYDQLLRLDPGNEAAGRNRERIAALQGARHAQPAKIALPEFLAGSPAETGLARMISQIITTNLKRSEKFTPIDQVAYTEKITNFDVPPRFSDWRTIHADTLVTGRVTRQPDGRLKVEFRLWDVQANAQLIGQQFLSTQDNPRSLANIISDVIYERVIGEKGNFYSRTSP
jgi:tetratricopeptide (TPR) repeat protein